MSARDRLAERYLEWSGYSIVFNTRGLERRYIRSLGMRGGAYVHLEHQGKQQWVIKSVFAEDKRQWSSIEVYLQLDQDISCDAVAPDPWSHLYDIRNGITIGRTMGNWQYSSGSWCRQGVRSVISFAKIDSSPSSPFSILFFGAVRPGYPTTPTMSPLLKCSCCFSNVTLPSTTSWLWHWERCSQHCTWPVSQGTACAKAKQGTGMAKIRTMICILTPSLRIS
jgi:hypothetical protein